VNTLRNGFRFPLWACAAAAAAGAGIVGCGAPPRISMDASALSKVRTVAVLPFKGGEGVAGSRPGDAMAAGLSEALRMEVPRYEQAERTRLKDLVSERKGSAAPGAAGDETELGKFLQVDAIITGTVREYSRSAYTREGGYFGGHTVSADVRIIDVRTGAVIYGCSGFANGRNNFTEAVTETCKALIGPLKTVVGGGRPGGN
jgi:hypothetical protein